MLLIKKMCVRCFMGKMLKARAIHLNRHGNERSHMKHTALMLVLMAICSFGPQPLCAGKGDVLYKAGYAAYKGSKSGLFTKRCPDCGGSGMEGWGRCGNCDGSGTVCNWVTIIILGVIVLGALCERQGRKKS